ncbi:MAG: transketolase [Rhodospirillaceae bacterium]|nr:transketolase [Rhodospirillaceae bacterium]MBT4486374.1 transketolase [Rhodospirillaceae bacterium]MBT5191387.1 transketolase [Rhodospirillaceae bacterium]MBT5896400.1 transketolase [Rhodospirillaceae bacterium]MBT6426098.1 transketolase [Rhodospirillaceae bacterium]
MRKTCLDVVYELAKKDDRVVFIGSDLGAGTLDQFRDEMPDRFFMEGVSEQNLIGMAAGLAMEGFIPYVNTIATFITRRCYEQVAVDLCLHNLPVKLIANGGGLVYAPLGPTHLAIEDMAILRALPRMTVFAPCDKEEMARLVPQTLEMSGPSYIRLAKGGDEIVSHADRGFEIGKAIQMRKSGKVLIVGTGITTTRALHAAEELADEGIECGVLHMHTVKPLDEDAILSQLDDVELLVTVEEHTLVGGLGSAVGDLLLDKAPRAASRLIRLGIPDLFSDKYGTQDELLEYYGLQGPQIAQRIRDTLNGDEEKVA